LILLSARRTNPVARIFIFHFCPKPALNASKENSVKDKKKEEEEEEDDQTEV
jgi:hypothetical protein